MTDIDNFVVVCQSMLGEPDVAERVAQAMRLLLQDPAGLSQAVEELRTGPGRGTVVHRSDELTVMGIEVPAGFVSPSHNHQLWSVVGVYQGNEDNVFYRRTEGGIEETGRAVLSSGECLAFPSDAVHRITNSGDSPMRALHVYGGDLFATQRSQWDDLTGEELPFGSDR